LAQLAGPEELVFAPAEFIYEYRGKFLHDVRYGHKTGKTAAAIAVRKSEFEDNMTYSRRNSPPLYEHLQGLFQGRCRETYSNATYAVYRCR
jgi:hypothetical protein